MEILRTVSDMQAVSRRAQQAGHRIGFVPTMGFLHDGHLSLMRLARESTDVLVVSLFVNPTQFGPGEDLDQYPRDFERDAKLCESCGVDVLFFPSVDEMYAQDSSVYVDENLLSEGLCGASRAGHFRGVLTVVAKLFNMVMPDVAVFGQKDAQQAALIRRMVRDLNYPIDVVVAPIVREPDGLAMSSRNTYLSPEERSQALWISKALKHAEALVAAGTISRATVEDAMRVLLNAEAPMVEVEYIAIVAGDTLAPVDQAGPGTLLAVAARVGKTRLIDNVLLK
jgi:pantoate--beta-alanine ligase